MKILFARSATRAILSASLLVAAAGTTPAWSAPVLSKSNTDFSAKQIVFRFDDSSFGFSGTGDYFNPAAVQTAGGGKVTSFGGFLGIPIQPSSDFYPARGSGQISFGPIGNSYSPFLDITTVPYSNGGNLFGLVAMLNGSAHYGFALTQDTTLISYGFESVADTPIDAIAGVAGASAVPEIGTWLMAIIGFALVGGMMRSQQTAPNKSGMTRVGSFAVV